MSGRTDVCDECRIALRHDRNHEACEVRQEAGVQVDGGIDLWAARLGEQSISRDEGDAAHVVDQNSDVQMGYAGDQLLNTFVWILQGIKDEDLELEVWKLLL